MATNNKTMIHEDGNSHDELLPKKRKLDNIIDGSIVNLKLKNFMTFTEVEYHGHPKLNLIIGPNGSGKSSIVTAFILGFGGSPKDINRGDKVSQFVKIGKSQADIYIELYQKSKKNMSLRRTIFIDKESCHFYVNNVIISKKKYIEIVESFNIKVHNLCQFLPQDRLEDFSKLDSKGLLLNTLQSIEDTGLLKTFEELKSLANGMSTFENDKKNLKNAINSEFAINSKLETIVNSFAEKKVLENQLLVVIQKRSWSVYILGWRQIQNEMKKFSDAAKHNSTALSLVNQQQDKVKKKESSKIDMKKIVLKNANVVGKLLEKLNKKVGTSESYVSDLKELNKTAKKTSMKIDDYKESIFTMEEKLESIKNETLNVDECKQELHQINEKILIIDQSINPMKKNLHDVKNKLIGVTEKILSIDQELRHEQRKEDSKNQLIERKFPELWKAVKWLRNCDKLAIFRGQVFEPLFTQIEMIDQKNAKYIENIIPYRDLIAFFFEYPDDLTKFNNIARKEGWKKINSLSAPAADLELNETQNHHINSLKEFGFYSYALDMIKTPLQIRRYLVRQFKMHSIPIGSSNVLNSLQHLPNDISFFFAGNDKIILKYSVYTNEKITHQSPISEAQFLLYSVDSNLIQSLLIRKEETKEECERYEKEQTELNNRLKNTEISRQPYFERKKEINGSLIKFQDKQRAFDKMVKDVQFSRSELKKEEERSTVFLNQNSQLISKYLDSMKEVVELLDSYAAASKTFAASAFIVNNCCEGKDEESTVLKQLKLLYLNSMNNFYDYLKYVQRLDLELKKMVEVALYWTKGVSPYDKNLFKPYNETFDTIEESDLGDLDKVIVEKRAKLNCLCIDPKAPQLIKEYKERKTKIKDLEKKLEDLNKHSQSEEIQIENIHSKWLPKLQKLVGSLCSNFQNFLTSFGCRGLIELDVGVTRYDFHSYGILIKVQFRNDLPSLRLLDAKCQSGGERALTTALFLLALQEVTHFPFRIVDEINQGMDKIYEKKLMELFMDLFETRNNQYLVITPKLIKDLSFKNTTVDIIYCIASEQIDDVDDLVEVDDEQIEESYEVEDNNSIKTEDDQIEYDDDNTEEGDEYTEEDD